MTQIEVNKQHAYLVTEFADTRVRKQYAYVVYQGVSEPSVMQLSKQVLYTPDTNLAVSQVVKQVLYQVSPLRPYKLSGTTMLFGNLGSLNPPG